jgi:hypothetical protein
VLFDYRIDCFFSKSITSAFYEDYGTTSKTLAPLLIKTTFNLAQALPSSKLTVSSVKEATIEKGLYG